MFKMGVFTDEVSQDFQTVVNLCKEYRLEGIEIRSVWDKPPQNISDDDIAEMKKILDGTGIKICSVASPFFKCELDSDEEYRQHIAILERCIHLAQSFDCHIVRGFTFWRRGRAEDVWQQILDKYQEPIKILERTGAKVGIENEASTYIGTGRALRKFLDDLGSPHVGAIWDPCNCLYDPDVQEVPFPDGYQAIKNRMIHMHLKDSKRAEGGGKAECVPIGEGDIDFRGQFKALVNDGYTGYVSLETHWRPAAALSEDERDKPGGAKFSESGEEASRICLNNTFKIFEEIGIKR
ncbi:MAG: sugar phosphate isomerase/epimerase family protein [Planctomycetota bacterium]